MTDQQTFDSAAAVLKRALRLGALVAAAVAVLAGGLGLVFAGIPGLVSGLVGAAFALLFLGVTAVGLIVGGRGLDSPLGPSVFFAVVLGGWLVKMVLFLVAMFLLRDLPWVQPVVLFLAIVATVIGSLAVDVVVVSKARIPLAPSR
jgi:hypothetical protein